VPDGVLPAKVRDAVRIDTQRTGGDRRYIRIGGRYWMLPLKVSFVVTLPIVVAVVDVGVDIRYPLPHPLQVLPTTTVAVAWSQLAGTCTSLADFDR
jgi:hypothetical protein